MSKVLKAIAQYANSKPSAAALSDGKQVLTYADLQENIRMSEALATLISEECIGIQADNSIAWVMIDLITIELGITSVPIPPFFTEEQREHALQNSNASLIISDREIPQYTKTHSLELAGTTLYFHRLAHNSTTPNDTAKITYTSGTTGNPQGIHLSQEAMENVATSLVEVIGKDAAARHMAVLPLSILLENIGGLYATILSGGCYIVKSLGEIGFAQSFRPNFLKLTQELENEKATSCILVPELLKGLVYLGKTLPHMQFIAVGGAKLSTEVLINAEQLALPVYQGYGLSESASVVAVNTPKNNKIGSVGKILPHIKYKIAEDGELILLHPASLKHQHGEYHTGDICHVDDDGYLYVTGRKKHVIINSFGRNISPEWPESEIGSSPYIVQIYVYGDGQPSLSALIVPIPLTTNEQIADAVNSANKNLPQYAQVKNWQLVQPFTIQNGMLTGTGRLRRKIIDENYQLNREEKHAVIL